MPPPLPKKKTNPDPDYEVIDFSHQQYSNTSPSPSKAIKDVMQANPADVGLKCELCGTIGQVIKCEQCVKNLFCFTCDDMFHRHPKRQNHLRKVRHKLLYLSIFIILFSKIFSELIWERYALHCHQKCRHKLQLRHPFHLHVVIVERVVSQVQCPKDVIRYAMFPNIHTPKKFYCM